MNLVFEDPTNFLNYLNCSDVVSSGARRFAPSPMAVTLLHRTQMATGCSVENKPRPYIIPSGVNHSPNDWAVYNGQSVFDSMNKKQINDLRDGKAMVLFDQSLEGYHASWLWDYFHKECAKHNISPEAIIYVTGNSLCAKQYDKWAEDNSIEHRITAIPYVHFEADVYNNSVWTSLNMSVDKHLEYKKK